MTKAEKVAEKAMAKREMQLQANAQSAVQNEIARVGVEYDNLIATLNDILDDIRRRTTADHDAKDASLVQGIMRSVVSDAQALTEAREKIARKVETMEALQRVHSSMQFVDWNV